MSIIIVPSKSRHSSNNYRIHIFPLCGGFGGDRGHEFVVMVGLMGDDEVAGSFGKVKGSFG